jgi:hypothetical protein
VNNTKNVIDSCHRVIGRIAPSIVAKKASVVALSMKRGTCGWLIAKDITVHEQFTRTNFNNYS